MLVAGVGIGWGRIESTEYQRQADNQAREYAAYTNQKIAQTCIGPASVDKAKCIAEARDKQRDYQYNQSDLVAQRQSALWAYIMGAAAVIGMGLSVIGVFLVWTTFRETKEANIISRKAMEAAQNEAKAARDALVLAERAIVEIRRITIMPDDRDNWLEATVAIENVGRSNAHRFRFEYSLCKEPVYPHDDGLGHLQRLRGICPPQMKLSFGNFAIRKPIDYPRFLIGVLEYSTIHDAIFKTYFCFAVVGNPHQEPALNSWVNTTLTEIFCPSLPPST